MDTAILQQESIEDFKDQANGDIKTFAEEDTVEDHEQPNPDEKKKKKRKKRPKSKRGLNASTGFEEYHADAPLTAEQVAEDMEVYNKQLSFIDRILTAIQRFERTRRMVSERRDVFYKYLAFGGVDCGQNMFQGGIDDESLDKDQLAAALARTSISDDKKDLDSVTSLYAVDFVGCMKAFLSHRAPVLFPLENKQQIELVTTTLERFMDYLLQHDVCPEYASDVLTSRNLCRAAATELWEGAQAVHWLPGDFNVACSTLSGGIFSHIYDGIASWAPENNEGSEYVGLTTQKAGQVIKYAIAGAAPEDVFQKYLALTSSGQPQVSVTETRRNVGFEITRINNLDDKCLEMYQSEAPAFHPVCLVYARPWRNPSTPPEDLTTEERELQKFCDAETADKLNHDEYVFFFEKPTLAFLRVGTRIEATIHRLSMGMWYFDEFARTYPSFEHWICNDLMVGWKEPRPIGQDHNGNESGADPADDGDNQSDDKVGQTIEL